MNTNASKFHASREYGRAIGYLNRTPTHGPELSRIAVAQGMKNGRIEYLSDILESVEDLLAEGKVIEAKNVLANRRK